MLQVPLIFFFFFVVLLTLRIYNILILNTPTQINTKLISVASENKLVCV